MYGTVLCSGSSSSKVLLSFDVDMEADDGDSTSSSIGGVLNFLYEFIYTTYRFTLSVYSLIGDIIFVN